MSEKVLCPYCGAEMFPTYNEGGVVKWACRCGAEAPVVVRKPEESFDDAAERARVLALRRYQPENRVLTLEEVYKIENDAPYYIEINKIEGLSVYSCGEDIKSVLVPYFGEDRINKTWRCWQRKPTEEERKAAHWAE